MEGGGGIKPFVVVVVIAELVVHGRQRIMVMFRAGRASAWVVFWPILAAFPWILAAFSFTLDVGMFRKTASINGCARGTGACAEAAVQASTGARAERARKC
jgi:hypothetical protein